MIHIVLFIIQVLEEKTYFVWKKQTYKFIIMKMNKNNNITKKNKNLKVEIITKKY